MGDLRCITIRNPWAWAIVHAGKTIENRSRPTNYRGTVGIHTAQRWSDEGGADWRIQTARAAHPDGSMLMDPGHVVAVVNLVDCHPAQECQGRCYPWGDPTGHHLVLTDVLSLTQPVPARGGLALPWRAPSDVADDVWGQLSEADKEGVGRG